jgi:hypothetical protein
MKIARTFGLMFAFVLALATLSAEAFAKRVDVVISKVSQKMTVYVDGRIEYVWPVSTGAAGYETPTGKFKPFRMEAEHFSKEWDDAPMPNSIFFTGDGHAIHGSFHVKSLGRRASHGCVRLAPDNAKILFDLVSEAGMSNTAISLKGGFFDIGYEPRRSFADVGAGIDKTIKKQPRRGFFWFSQPKPKVVLKKVKAKKVAVDANNAKAKKPDPKAKVAVKDVKKPVAKPAKTVAQCVTKDPKKPCKKVPAAKVASAG